MSDIKSQFINEVKLRAYDDKYVDRNEEKEILQKAIEQGVALETARSALIQVCESEGYVLESVLDDKAREMLAQFSGNDGVIDKKEFEDTVAIICQASKGRLSDSKCKKKVKQIVLDNEWKVKEGLFSGGKWFSEI